MSKNDPKKSDIKNRRKSSKIVENRQNCWTPLMGVPIGKLFNSSHHVSKGSSGSAAYSGLRPTLLYRANRMVKEKTKNLFNRKTFSRSVLQLDLAAELAQTQLMGLTTHGVRIFFKL